MNDDPHKRENEIYQEELKKLQEQQKERDFLKDRSIGGENAPRPTDDFIEQSLGKDMSRKEISAEASERTDKRMGQEKDVEERKEKDALDKMDRGDQQKANKSSDQKSDGQANESPSEKMKRKKEERRDQPRGR